MPPARQQKKSDPTAGMDSGDTIAKLMQPFYQALLEDAFLDAADAGVEAVFDLANPYVQATLDALTKQIRAVAETTKDDIRLLVGRQAEEGWSSEELAKQIRAKGDIASRSRSLTIARTERARPITRARSPPIAPAALRMWMCWTGMTMSRARAQTARAGQSRRPRPTRSGIRTAPAHFRQ
jgi:hypothetical protein